MSAIVLKSTTLPLQVKDVGRHNKWPHKKGHRGFVYFIGVQMLGTTANESALELNKAAILPHWTQLQRWAHRHRQAMRLDEHRIREIYDLQRWDALKEDVDV